MRALITGVRGFVGQYLAKQLIAENVEIWGTSRGESPEPYIQGVRLISTDLTDESEIVALIEDIRPDYIFHLAGQSSVHFSWENKIETFNANVECTIRLLEAIRKSKFAKSVKILTVGSSEEYGKIDSSQTPITELTSLRPISPYGISKATVSFLLSHYYNSYGLQIIHARPFNHIGPGQNLGFVTTDFAKQIVEIEKGVISSVIKVGNLEAKRDFTDVRDIVKGYSLLMRRGKPGEAYNVCSGVPVSIMDILYWFIKRSFNQSIQIVTDANNLRKSDIPLHFGSAEKMRNQTGWTTEISLDSSLQDILDFWREKYEN
ncbi:GDP-mannose 4,6-dehydratase [Brevibacillus sp. 179-C9.3 HS]|uniref:GDP-mannose 4,6-dehydratase n=1 Tax=unclassified Brevibacillus TaxID=2684853 RepID=UPI0039A3CAF1